MKLFAVLALCGPIWVTGSFADAKLSSEELRKNGLFGFPQKEAQVVYDTPDLLFSVWNNEEYLFGQALLWKDNDGSLGQTDDGRKIGDWSQLMLDLDGDGKETRGLDRDYMLNPWPGMEGLRYSVSLGAGSTTGIQSDSKGQGAIRHVETSDGKTIRVDTYLIPLAELSKRKVGDKISICYWGSSPTPSLTVNSAGYDRAGKLYYSHHVPRSSFQPYNLVKRKEIDISNVPEGRKDISLAPRKMGSMPTVGKSAPEVSAKEWMNIEGKPTLESLRGNVVLVEFWATWCGPCVKCIPQLNELHKKYSGRKFQLLSFTGQPKDVVDKFLKKTPINYAIGFESDDTFDRYGVSGIPHAFLIDPSGKIVWEGHSASADLEKHLEKIFGPTE